MLGLSRFIRDAVIIGHEFCRLEADGEGVVLTAMRSEQEPTPFRLVEAAPGLAVFENLDHDFQGLEWHMRPCGERQLPAPANDASRRAPGPPNLRAPPTGELRSQGVRRSP